MIDFSIFKQGKFWMWVVIVLIMILVVIPFTLTGIIIAFLLFHKTSFSNYLAPYYSNI